MSEGLVKNGIIHTIDSNEELNTIQNKYFKKTNNSNSIIQHIGDAKEVIKKIDEIFDIIFIDADKENYIQYYNLSIDKLKCYGPGKLWTLIHTTMNLPNI